MKTALTRLTGCRYPIVQTGMGYVAGPRLVSASCRAGALGIIASATMSPAEPSGAIDEVRSRTDAPFIASVGALRHAQKVAEWGAHAVIVQGGGGGGHTGAVPTSLLVPQIVDAVDIPVVAAGGFFDGRGLVAALAYGACGIAMGTRFLLTSDSPVALAVKEVYLGKGLQDTVVTTRVDGVPHRVLRTSFVDSLGRLALPRAIWNAARFRRLSGMSWTVLVKYGLAMRRARSLSWSQVLMAANTPMLLRSAMVEGRPDPGVMASGQVVGLIDDLPSCAVLVERIMRQAGEVLAALPRGS